MVCVWYGGSVHAFRGQAKAFFCLVTFSFLFLFRKGKRIFFYLRFVFSMVNITQCYLILEIRYIFNESCLLSKKRPIAKPRVLEKKIAVFMPADSFLIADVEEIVAMGHQ